MQTLVERGRPAAAPTPPGDGALVRRARAGDSSAYCELYRRHEHVVTGVVRRRLGFRADANDVVQEVFVAAWQKLDSLREPARFRAWVLQIAHRAAIDAGRRRTRTEDRLDDDEVALGTAPDPRPSPEELLEVAELARALGDALAILTRREATAVTLAAQLGFGTDEIAVALGVSPGNARVILHRARRRLRAAVA